MILTQLVEEKYRYLNSEIQKGNLFIDGYAVSCTDLEVMGGGGELHP